MSTSASSQPRLHTRFCGIDVGKTKHVACIIDREGTRIVPSQSFANHAEGYQRLLGRLQETGGPQQVTVGMEATGHYWYSLHEFLIGRQYQVAVLNPLQTARRAAQAIRKTQTDRIDAHHIAVLIKNGEYRPALIPGEVAMTCRRLTRLHRTLRRQEARIKQLLWAWIHPVWPEYETIFANPFCQTSRTLLDIGAHPPGRAGVAAGGPD